MCKPPNGKADKFADMQTLQQRMALFMRETGLKVGEIAHIAGVTSSAVSQWAGVKGKASAKIGDLEAAIKIEKKTGFSALWLARGTGPMHVAHREINLDGNPNYLTIRRVVLRLSAGASGYAIDYPKDEDAPIVNPREWFERNHLVPEKLFAARVINGSMEPGLFDGDTVVINTGDTEARDGEVFAVNYDGELVIKRMIRDAGQWWLSSDNPNQAKYPRKVCTEDTHIIGRIVQKQSMHI